MVMMKLRSEFMTSNTPASNSDVDKLIERIEDVINKNNGDKSPEIGRLYNQLGNACFKSEDFASARNAYTEALHTYEIASGSNHPYVAVSLGNLGTAQWKMGDYESSAESMEDSVRILHECSGGSDENVMVAEALHNLGTVKVLMKDFEGAKNVLDRALYGRIKMLGKYHVDVARTRDKLGLVYMMTGDTQKSKKHHSKALQAKINTLGQNHPSTIVSLMNLARLHRHEGDYDVAIQQYREAFEIQSKLFHNDIAVVDSGITMHIIGDVQLENSSYFGALSSFRQALSIFEDAGLKSDDERIRAVQKNVSRAQNLLKESDLFTLRETNVGGTSF